MSEGQYLAARETDCLLHTSLLADFVSGVVKGAIYFTAGALACAALAVTGPAALIVGAAVGLAVGFIFSEAIDEVADEVASWFPPSQDAVIATGSVNVRTKMKPAARAAGKIAREALLDKIAFDKANPPKDKALQIAEGILQKSLMLAKWITPLGTLESAYHSATSSSEKQTTQDNDITPPAKEEAASKPGFWESVGNNILSPTVAEALPGSTPEGLDKVICTKWHFNNDGPYIAEGSASVQINSQPASRKNDRSTCEAKIAPMQTGSKVRIGGNSVVVRDIHSGKNPFMSMLGEVAGGTMAGIAKSLIRTGLKAVLRQALMACAKDTACYLITDMIITPLAIVGGAVVGEALSRAASSSHPVQYARGDKVLTDESELDFVLDGQIPLFWQRTYNSSNVRKGVLGTGWNLPFEFSLEIRDRSGEEAIFYIDRSGRELGLGVLLKGMSARYIDEGFTLYRSTQDQFLLQTDEGIFYLFERNPFIAGSFRLQQQLDRHENKIEYHYDSEGLLKLITDDVQQNQIALNYDTKLSRLIQVKQIIYQQQERVEKVLVSYYYNHSGELISVRDADERLTRHYSYDPVHHLMTEHTYSTGLTAHYRYHHFNKTEKEPAHWRVVEHWLQDQDKILESMQINYDLERQQVEVIESGKGSSYRRWGKNYLIRDFVDELDNVWKFEWNEVDKLTCVIDPADNKWQFEYDLYGNLAHSVDPEGQKTHTKWDEDFAYPLIRVMPDGGTWRYQYNVKGDLVALVNPEGQETQFAYDNTGNRVYQRDAEENETHFRYNLRGQLESQTDCSGNVTRYFYNDFGQLASIHNALQETQRYVISPAGKLREIIFPNGSSRQYNYNVAGLVSDIKENGQTYIHYDYNVRGQVTEQRHGSDTLRLKYDDYGRLSILFNEKGEQYRFRYNALDLLTEEWRLDGTSRQLIYNTIGELVQETLQGKNGGKIETRFIRDKIGRLLVKDNEDCRTEYDYGPRELTIRKVSQHDFQCSIVNNQQPEWQTISFAFNTLGKLTKEHNHQGDYQYNYDKTGNLSETLFPDGSALRHLYYGSGHLLQSIFTYRGQQHLLAEYSRDNLHREISRTQGSLLEFTEYDALGRVTARLAQGLNSGKFGQVKIARQYQYNRQNQLQSTRLSLGKREGLFPCGNAKTITYEYDQADRVIARYTDTGAESFNYDAAGNLLINTPQAISNQPEEVGFVRYAYDEFGRIVRRTSKRDGSEQHFHYNSSSQVISVEFTRHKRYKHVRYDYDALGRRIAKILTYIDPNEGDIRTDFHWQEMRLSGEQTTGQALSYHFYHEGSYVPLARFDCREEENSKQAETGDLWFVHAESNGMPLLISDRQGELVWQQNEASLFGRITQEKSLFSPHVAKQNLRFAGQYHDIETGLHYNTFRFYDPESGRFTQPDPIGLRGGLNLYAYAPNPLSWIDPLGLSCFYRGSRKGESVSFEAKLGEYRIDKATGQVKTTHGVSVFDNPTSVSSKGFDPHKIDMSTVSDDLKIIQRGNDPKHYEIVPSRPMSVEDYQAALSKIKVLN